MKKRFQNGELAALFAEILERMTGNRCNLEYNSPRDYRVYRDVGDKWELA